MFDQLTSLVRHAATLAALTDADLEQVDGEALGDAIVQLDCVVRRLEAVRLSVTRAHSRSLAWKRDGARSPAQWHRDHRAVSPGQATREVDTAHALAELPRTAAGVAAGEVSAAQASIAARARRGLTDDQSDALDALTAEVAPDATERQLRDAVTDFTHELDPDGVVERERQAHARRALQIGRTRDGGWWIDARFGTVGGTALATALSSMSAPRGEDDPRTADQRRADALVDLAEGALRGRDLPMEGGVRPAVTITADIATLERRAGAPAGRTDHSGPVSSETVRQIACDATIHRVITRGTSEVLDVGRGSRTVTIAQRRALAVRDGGCVGCGAPAAWTDAHHIVHWADGGATDLVNLVLLCRSCHTGVHHRRWLVGRDARTGHYRIRRPARRRPQRIDDDDGSTSADRGTARATSADRGAASEANAEPPPPTRQLVLT